MTPASEEADFRRLLQKEEATLRATFRGARLKMVEQNRILRGTIQYLRSNHWNCHASLWNTCLFINLAALDLSSLVEATCYEQDRWTQGHHSRSTALLLFEICDDIQTLLGKNFRDSLASLGVLDRFAEQLAEVRKPLNEFRRANEAAFERVRAITAAHRDHDALLMLEEIERLKWMDMVQHGIAFSKILNNIGASLQKMVTATSEIVPPERTTRE